MSTNTYLTSSILNTIKPMIGVEVECTDFDAVLVPHINTVFTRLCQIGAGPRDGFYITGPDETWTDYYDGDSNAPWLHTVKSYVALKTRMLFDPPLQSSVATATEKALDELEFAISVAVDPGWSQL